MDISLLLDHSDFFKGFSDKSKQALASICEQITLTKREILFYEGDEAQAMYLCAVGNMQIYKSGLDGKESVIKIIGPGEIFAEVILFEKDTFPASAVALKKSIVYRIPKQKFYKLLSEERFRNDFIRLLMQKQRYLINKIHDLSSLDVEERFLRFLVEQYGKKQEYRIVLPKKDIALAIGTTSETFSRLLGRMQKEGILTIEKGKIVLPVGYWNRE